MSMSMSMCHVHVRVCASRWPTHATLPTQVAAYLDERLQSRPIPSGRPPDMSEAAGAAMRAALAEVCAWHARTCTPCTYTHVHPADLCMCAALAEVGREALL